MIAAKESLYFPTYLIQFETGTKAPRHTQVRLPLSWRELGSCGRSEMSPALQCRVILSPKLQLVRLVQCSAVFWVANVWILSLKYYEL